MRHPEAGELSLRREKLPIGDSGGQLLVIYHAEPGSDSAHALSSLAGGVTASRPQAGVSGPDGAFASGFRPR
jgi:hypothetical protein